MEYKRENNLEIKPLERIKNFNEFHVPMSEEAVSYTHLDVYKRQLWRQYYFPWERLSRLNVWLLP